MAQEKLGQEPNEGLVRAMGPFGAGLAASGEVCGNVVGALATFGLIFSRSREEEDESPMMWKYSQKFMRSFKERIGGGSIFCRDLVGVDWKDKEQVKNFHSSGKYKECLRFTGEAARLLGEMIDQYESEKRS